MYTNVTWSGASANVGALLEDHRWVLFRPNIDERARPSNLVRSWRHATRVYTARIINGAGNELIIINNI